MFSNNALPRQLVSVAFIFNQNRFIIPHFIQKLFVRFIKFLKVIQRNWLLIILKMKWTKQRNTKMFSFGTHQVKHLVYWSDNYMKCFIYWTADLKSSQLWSSHLWTQFKQLRRVAWKSQNFNGVWTRDLAILVQRSNQPTYEATVSVTVQ